jgi:hypothetical protein
MTTFRLLIIASTIALVLAGCRKDKIDNGPFAIEPKDYLSSKKYSELQIEICYVDGYAPEQEALDNLKAFLAARINKPDGITFTFKNIGSPGEASFTEEELEKLEKNQRSEYSRKDRLVVFVFFADAGYSTAGTLGLKYGHSSVAVFEKTLKDNSGGFGQPSKAILETTVLEHEFGHLLGLVDAGTDMVTAHAADGHHCSNSDCLMYYAVETLDFVGNLSGGDVPELDAHCIADLQANGGK